MLMEFAKEEYAVSTNVTTDEEDLMVGCEKNPSCRKCPLPESAKGKMRVMLDPNIIATIVGIMLTFTITGII